MEYVFAAVLLVAGTIGAVGLYLGLRDPVTKPYKPGIWGMFGGGYLLRSLDDSKEPRH
jgi:hypothetical protein